jgi:archaellum component FlaC
MDDILKQILVELKEIRETTEQIDQRLVKVEETTEQIDQRLVKVEEDTQQIRITIENDISKQLGALSDGFKLNAEKLDSIKSAVEEIDSTVAALDIKAQLESDRPITLKIIK